MFYSGLDQDRLKLERLVTKENPYKEYNQKFQKKYRLENLEKLNAYHREYRAANREKIRAKQNAKYAANKEEISKNRRALWAANREVNRAKKREEYRTNATAYIKRAKEYKKTPQGKLVNKDSWLKQKYGISLAQWEAMSLSQNGLCKVCKTEKVLHTDHCHKTGIVRGLLCHGCNVGLGGFRDNTEFMLAGIEYLKEKR